MSNKDEIRGKAKALKKTSGAIMEFLGDNSKQQNEELRDFLYEKLADLASHWYKRGVRRGHMESYKEWKTTGALSAKLRYETEREFFSNKSRSVRVKSKIES
jgi:hypothetical protein